MNPLNTNAVLRQPEHYSPSQVSLFFTDRDEYYNRYLSPVKPPRMKQTVAMALGGVFDSIVKNKIALRYLGHDNDGEYGLESMFAHAIDPDGHAHHVKDKMIKTGTEIFNWYCATGTFDSLLRELDLMDAGSLLMERRVYGKISHRSGVDASKYLDARRKGLNEYVDAESLLDIDSALAAREGEVVSAMGLPDLSFSVGGTCHIYDWKCNGFFSKAGASPIKGYIRKVPNKGSDMVHKDALVGVASSGVRVDLTGYFDDTYVRQVSTYKMALAPVDGHLIAGIEQVACKEAGVRWKERTIERHTDGAQIGVTFASARAIVPHERVEQVLDDYLIMDAIIKSGWIFDDRTREVSDKHIEHLNKIIASGDNDFNQLVGR